MKANSNETMWVLGHKISVHNPTGDYDMVVGETPPGVPGPPPHYHSEYNELFMVLEGTMDFMVNGEIVRANVGDSVTLSPGSLHTFSNAGDSTCKWVNIHSPKGFLSFFKSFGVDVHQQNAVEKSVDKKMIEKVLSTAADFDMVIKV
jgi:mannose-6-phosphate isomerase-like protein (cupin superfamily)